VPSVPDTGVRTDDNVGDVEIELGAPDVNVPDVNEVVPEAPRVLPEVELPSVQLPEPEDVTGSLPDTLQNTLP
jgi:hypothetical protein